MALPGKTLGLVRLSRLGHDVSWVKAWSLVREPDAGDLHVRFDARQSDEWQAATEALLMAAEDRGPLLHARVGMLRALNRNVERVFDQSRKDTRWGKRKLVRDRWRDRETQRPPSGGFFDRSTFGSSLSLSFQESQRR
jgi:hypothetical protein